jgi:hypothetical protein
LEYQQHPFTLWQEMAGLVVVVVELLGKDFQQHFKVLAMVVFSAAAVAEILRFLATVALVAVWAVLEVLVLLVEKTLKVATV